MSRPTAASFSNELTAPASLNHASSHVLWRGAPRRSESAPPAPVGRAGGALRELSVCCRLRGYLRKSRVQRRRAQPGAPDFPGFGMEIKQAPRELNPEKARFPGFAPKKINLPSGEFTDEKTDQRKAGKAWVPDRSRGCRRCSQNYVQS